MSGRRKRRQFSEEFKHEIIELYRNGKPRIEIITEYNITPSVFSRWISEAKEDIYEKKESTEKLDESFELSRANLETFSMEELISLADGIGLFIPQGVSRNFIIGELLEFAEEDKYLPKIEIEPQTDFTVQEDFLPPKNNIEMYLFLRDPIWLFTFWEFNTKFYTELISDNLFESFFLRVIIFKDPLCTEYIDHYDIGIEKDEKNRYVYLPIECSGTKTELWVRYYGENEKFLASSNNICLNRSNIAENLCASHNIDGNIMSLSGLSLIKKTHFKNYKQIFY